MADPFRGAPDDLDADALHAELAFWRARLPEVGSEEIQNLIDAADEKADQVAAVAVLDLFSDAWEATEGAEANALPLDAFAEQVTAQLEDAWGGGEDDPSTLDLIASTNLQDAFSDARHSAMGSNRDDFPYWEFVSERDDRVCEMCDECDGVILPADDPWWEEHSPQLHFRCRCMKQPLTQAEAEKFGVTDEPPDVDADDGFGSTLLPVEPDLSTRPPELVHEFHRDLKDEG